MSSSEDKSDDEKVEEVKIKRNTKFVVEQEQGSRIFHYYRVAGKVLLITPKMFPNNEVDILVVRLTSISNVHPKYPLIKMTRKKHSPSGSMTVVRDWFDRTISAEKARLPPNAVLRFPEYRILINDTELFEIGQNRFDEVVLVIGEEFSYWIFYQSTPPFFREEGQAVLPISYCVCCFHNHYERVMKTVKESFCKSQLVDKS